jgi:multidrug resistance efflux pump
MRILPSPRARLAAVTAAAALLGTACSGVQELSGTVDKVQACAEATQIVSDVTAKVTSLASDPAELGKALDDAAAKLESTAAKAGDTTLKDALNGLADSYQKLDFSDANAAVDAAQKAASDTARHLQTITQACSGT